MLSLPAEARALTCSLGPRWRETRKLDSVLVIYSEGDVEFTKNLCKVIIHVSPATPLSAAACCQRLSIPLAFAGRRASAVRQQGRSRERVAQVDRDQRRALLRCLVHHGRVFLLHFTSAAQSHCTMLFPQTPSSVVSKHCREQVLYATNRYTRLSFLCSAGLAAGPRGG